MISQNKIFSFRIEHQATNVFPTDVLRTVDCVNAQADLNLCWVHMFEFTISDIAVRLLSCTKFLVDCSCQSSSDDYYSNVLVTTEQ